MFPFDFFLYTVDECNIKNKLLKIKYILKDSRVPTVVNTMLRLILPPKRSDHTLEAPPPGLMPVKNTPSCIGTEFGNINLAKK